MLSCYLLSALFGGLIGWGIKGLLTGKLREHIERTHATQLDSHRAQLRAETDRYQALVSVNDAATRSLSERETEFNNLRVKFEDVGHARDAAEKKYADLFTAHGNLKNDLESLRAELRTAHESIAQGARDKADLETRVDDERKRLADTAAVLAQEQAKNATTTRDLAKAHADAAEVTKSLDAATHANHAANAKQRELEAMVTKLTSDAEKARSEAHAKASEFEAKLRAVNEEIGKVRADGEAKLKAALAERDTAQQGIAKARADLQAIQTTEAQSAKSLTEVRSDLAQRVAALAALQVTYATLQKQHDNDAVAWKNKFDATAGDLDRSRAELRKRDDALALANKTVAETTTRVGYGLRDVESLKTQLADRDAKLKSAADAQAVATRRLAELESQGTALSAELATLRTKSVELQKRLSEHESASTQAQALLKARQVELEGWQARQKDWDERTAQTARVKAETDATLNANAQRLSALAAQVAERERAVADAQQRATAQSEEATRLKARLQQLEQSVSAERSAKDAKDAEIARLRSDAEKHTREIAALRGTLEEEAAKTDIANKEMARLSGQRARYEALAGDLSGKDIELNRLRARIVAMQSEGAQWSAWKASAEAQKKAQEDEVAGLRTRMQVLEREHDALRGKAIELDRLRAQSANLQTREASLQNDVRARDSSLTAAQDEIAQLRREAQMASANAEELKRLRSQIESLLADGRRSAAAEKSALDRLAGKESEFARAQSGLLLRATRAETELERLRAELERARTLPTTAPARVPRKRAVKTVTTTAPAPIARKRVAPKAPVKKAAPRVKRAPIRDDLKLIYGVGPVLEKFLHKQGVFRFRDVARWSERDINRFEELLPNFKGRIHREGWVKSARDEHVKKYGKDPIMKN